MKQDSSMWVAGDEGHMHDLITSLSNVKALLVDRGHGATIECKHVAEAIALLVARKLKWERAFAKTPQCPKNIDPANWEKAMWTFSAPPIALHGSSETVYGQAYTAWQQAIPLLHQ